MNLGVMTEPSYEIWLVESGVPITVIGVSPGSTDTGGSFGSACGGATVSGTSAVRCDGGTVASTCCATSVVGAGACTTGAVVVGVDTGALVVGGVTVAGGGVVEVGGVVGGVDGAVAAMGRVRMFVPDDDGVCAALATPANAAIPAASPATGRMTFRRNSSPCRRRASVGEHPSTFAI